MISTRIFGKTQDGKEVLAFTFTDGPYKATVLNYGGIIQSIVVPDRNGNPVDVILGYNDIAGYENNGGYLGALIGRFVVPSMVSLPSPMRLPNLPMSAPRYPPLFP